LTWALILLALGCHRVPGNYPGSNREGPRYSALFTGDGFQLRAVSPLRLDRVRKEMEQLKSQGFSPHDPQIIESVARRRRVPPALLADRSGVSYYRFSARLDPGVGLQLAPGALKLRIKTPGGIRTVHDQGYLLVDHSFPGGCRPPGRSTLSLPSPAAKAVARSVDFLVRLPVRGEIVELDLDPRRCRFENRAP
jgi:hypothetical protein